MNRRSRQKDLANRLSVAEADAAISEHVGALLSERVPLATARGRLLAEPVVADRDLPPFDRVTMDGIAFRIADAGAGRLPVVGVQAAGDAPIVLPTSPGCVEIMTGAALPAGADCVVPVERIVRNGNEARIEAGYEPVPGQFIHRRGSDQREGHRVLSPGMAIGAAETAVLASVGCANPPVVRRCRIAIVSTGSELVDVETTPAAHQIRSSNDWALESLATSTGLAEVTRARVVDDREAIRQRVLELHRDHDWIVLSGGVSMGKYDYVPEVLEALGAHVVFHKVRQRPGLPMWFGMSGDGKPLFALPGNPVSTLVCANRYLVPALRQAAGMPAAPPDRVKLDEGLRFEPALTWFVPVRTRTDDNGQCWGSPTLTNTSGDFAALAGTSGFVELPEELTDFEPGTVARFFPWP